MTILPQNNLFSIKKRMTQNTLPVVLFVGWHLLSLPLDQKYGALGEIQLVDNDLLR